MKVIELGAKLYLNSKISGFLDLILKIAGVAAVASATGSFILQWKEGISTRQLIVILVAIFCFLLVAVILFLQWRERRKFENIPDVLEKMDKYVLDYIEDYNIQLSVEEWSSLFKEIGKLLNINLGQFQAAILRQDMELVEREFSRISKAYDRHAGIGKSIKNMEQSLNDILDMGSMMDSYDIGLENIKKTKEYHKLSNKIKNLQRKAPSVNISNKVNDDLTPLLVPSAS